MSTFTKLLILLLASPLETWARECQVNGPAHIGVSENNQLLVCSGANGTAKVVGNVDVEGRVTTTEPSERDKALERNLTAALQRIEQQDHVIENMNGTISELKDALQRGGAVNTTSGMNVTHYGDLVNCNFYLYRDLTLTHITGNLVISDCTGLSQISYLSSLTTVRGDLSITSNDALTDVNGLSSLTTIGGNLTIQYNNALTDVSGLSGLTTLGGGLDITSNAALFNVNGLSSLTTVGGDLTIRGNDALPDMNGLTSLASVGGGLSIRDNAALINAGGLSNLTTMGGDLYISSNDALTDINGLSSLTTVGGFLIIVENDALTDVNGLSSLTTVSGNYMRICSNDRLSIIPSFFTPLSASKSHSSQCLMAGSDCC